MSNKTVSIALVGCGTVGGATAVLLTRDRELLRLRSGVELKLAHIVDKDFTIARKLGLDEALFQPDLDKALADPEVSIVIELVGGTTFAKTLVEKALNAGKRVVTANKALLATYGPELFALARSKNLSISFEASCGGGIPVIRALYDGLIANRIDALYGIVNGTCNYILTQMTDEGQAFADALADAQKDGLAEADPTLDISGMDSAHKLAIMSGLAFGARFDLADIPVSGINTLDSLDVSYGLEMGYVVKLLAMAHRQGDGLCLRVRPAFISQEHPLAWVSGPFNAVSIYGHANGHTMYYGRGAGGSPTASAVTADVISCALGTTEAAFRSLGIWSDVGKPAKPLPVDQVESRYYLRLMASDEVGVLARIATVLSNAGISIASLLQHELPGDSSAVPIVILTHRATEGKVRSALATLQKDKAVSAPPVCIEIVDEHEEAF